MSVDGNGTGAFPLQVSSPALRLPLCGAKRANLPCITSKRNFLPRWAVWALERTRALVYRDMEKVKRLAGGGGLRREPEGRHLVCERKVLKRKKGKDTEGWRVAHSEECPLLTHKTLASILNTE